MSLYAVSFEIDSIVDVPCAGGIGQHESLEHIAEGLFCMLQHGNVYNLTVNSGGTMTITTTISHHSSRASRITVAISMDGVFVSAKTIPGLAIYDRLFVCMNQRVSVECNFNMPLRQAISKLEAIESNTDTQRKFMVQAEIAELVKKVRYIESFLL